MNTADLRLDPAEPAQEARKSSGEHMRKLAGQGTGVSRYRI